ncbi:MAG: type II toxin-antitoxin system PemK/MazF family toxin [Phycicoccus sp.]
MRGDVHEVKAPRGVRGREQRGREQRGREQRGRRYAVVVQSDLLPLSTWLVAPTSASARPASFRPEIEIAGRASRVLTEQTAAVDPERLGNVVGHLSQAEMMAVNAALRVVLGLDQ